METDRVCEIRAKVEQDWEGEPETVQQCHKILDFFIQNPDEEIWNFENFTNEHTYIHFFKGIQYLSGGRTGALRVSFRDRAGGAITKEQVREALFLGYTTHHLTNEVIYERDILMGFGQKFIKKQTTGLTNT